MFSPNKFVEKQDYEFAEGLSNALDNLDEKDEMSLIRQKAFYFEGIFLDLTDRTEAHPRVPFATEERGGILENVIKNLGFGNRKIIWSYNELFNADKYFEQELFPVSLETNDQLYDELYNTKELYYRREINFFEYFLKRLQVYEKIEANLFMKYYEGVDMQKYKKKLSKIFDGLPVMTKRGEFDF